MWAELEPAEAWWWEPCPPGELVAVRGEHGPRKGRCEDHPAWSSWSCSCSESVGQVLFGQQMSCWPNSALRSWITGLHLKNERFHIKSTSISDILILKKVSPYLFNAVIVRYSNFIIRNIPVDEGMGSEIRQSRALGRRCGARVFCQPRDAWSSTSPCLDVSSEQGPGGLPCPGGWRVDAAFFYGNSQRGLLACFPIHIFGAWTNQPYKYNELDFATDCNCVCVFMCIRGSYRQCSGHRLMPCYGTSSVQVWLHHLQNLNESLNLRGW